MTIIQTQHNYRIDLDSCPLEAALTRPLSHTDALADALVLHVRRGQTPVQLSGMSAQAYLICSTRQTLPIAAEVADASVTVPLPAEAYAIPGPFRLTVQLLSGESRHTLLHLRGEIARSTTDALIASDQLLPTLPELIDDVAQMRAATDEALAAADTANAAAEAAAQDVQTAIDSVNATLSDALQAVNSAIEGAAPAIIPTAAGTVVTLTDGAARPVQGLVSTITAAQAGSGDPSPDNVRPITGWDAVGVTRAGANLLDPAWQPDDSTFYDLTVTRADGRITFDGTWTQSGSVDYELMPSTYLSAGSYHLSGCPAGGTSDTYRHFVQIISADGTRTYKNDMGSGVSFEVPEGGRVIIYLRFGASLGTVSGLTFAPMLAFGTAALPFEPYRATDLTAALPETVYGGSLDWTTGLLTVTHRMVQLDGTEAWYSNVNTIAGQYYCAGLLEQAPAGGDHTRQMCSHFAPGKAYAGVGDGIIQASNKTMWLLDTSIAAVSDLTAYLAAQAAAGTPVTIVYELSTPRTIQLDPQTMDMLKGYNALWSNTGDTSVAYVADTKLYIDNAIAAIAAAVINA